MTLENIADADIFGSVRMAYVVIESNRLDAWRRFLKQGVGLHLESETEDLVAFRMDEHVRRLIVRKGRAEDIVAVGWQLRDSATLECVLRRLSALGIAAEDGSSEEAGQRGVVSLLRLKGPKALDIELFVDAVTTDQPLSMLNRDGFVTGASGMGHIALTSRRPEKVQGFWQEIFDARLSDRISQPMGGTILDVSFLRLNERHHSIAIAATRGLRLDPVRTKVQHMNMVVNAREDLFDAFERLRDLGFEMAHEIGQHPNDKEVSFYVVSPSGFEIELGWDALTVDEASWVANHYNAISLWGHKPENPSALNGLLTNLGNLRRGLHAALKPEHSPL